MRRRSAAAMLAWTILVAGCQAAAPASDPVADLARETLASKLGVPQERISVVSVAAVDWLDGSLGCPQPGMSYLTVVSPGHKVMLEVDGRAYAVHEAKGRAIVCEQPALASEAGGGGPPSQNRLMLTARMDLAKRLGVPVQEIEAAGSAPKTFADASLGCPEAGMQYAQVLTEGWVLTLRHGTRDFTYHADAHHVIPCPGIAAR